MNVWMNDWKVWNTLFHMSPYHYQLQQKSKYNNSFEYPQVWIILTYIKHSSKVGVLPRLPNLIEEKSVLLKKNSERMNNCIQSALCFIVFSGRAKGETTFFPEMDCNFRYAGWVWLKLPNEGGVIENPMWIIKHSDNPVLSITVCRI